MDGGDIEIKKTVLLIMGKSGCGKSTLERKLITAWPTVYKKVVSHTTRPPRPKEQDGRDYHFVSNEQFDKTDFIQTTEFANNRYGSAVSEYSTKHEHPILCVVPESAKRFTETLLQRFPGWGTLNIWFDISDERLMSNMRKRGDTEEQIKKRVAADTLDEQFRQSGLVANLVVRDDDLDNPVYEKLVNTEIFLLEVTRNIQQLTMKNWNVSL